MLNCPLAWWLACCAALVLGLAADVSRGGPEAAIRSYFNSLGRQRVDEALSALTPESRQDWRAFLEFQQLNSYRLLSAAVRSPSLLDSALQGLDWRPTQATVIVEVTEPGGHVWRGSSVVPLRFDGERWLLSRPPLAP